MIEQAARVLEALALPLELYLRRDRFWRLPAIWARLCRIRRWRRHPCFESRAVWRGDHTSQHARVFFPGHSHAPRAFDLYANLRPCRSIPHPISRPGINLVLLRENTEDLYAGIERVEENGDRAVGEMVITRRASERIARKAFQVARASRFSQGDGGA